MKSVIIYLENVDMGPSSPRDFTKSTLYEPNNSARTPNWVLNTTKSIISTTLCHI